MPFDLETADSTMDNFTLFLDFGQSDNIVSLGYQAYQELLGPGKKK